VSNHIESSFIYFTNNEVNKIAVDTIRSTDNSKINVYYLGTNDGRVIKLVDSISNSLLTEVSEWKICDESIEELKIKEVN
jgi:hypothetical protein